MGICQPLRAAEWKWEMANEAKSDGGIVAGRDEPAEATGSPRAGRHDLQIFLRREGPG
jgi:hypothetical protein